VLLWMLNTVGATCLVVWRLALVSQIVLRRRADRDGTELPLRMWAFPWLSYLALALLAGIVLLGLLDDAVRAQLLLTAGLVALIALAARTLGRRPEHLERPPGGQTPS
jgi:amino acid transporter, AAT family